MSNLPQWTGADVAYGRLMRAANTIQLNTYLAQRRVNKGKRFKFSPNEDALEITRALNAGDEETCKAPLAVHHEVIWSLK